jgi:hypothetical protein
MTLSPPKKDHTLQPVRPKVQSSFLLNSRTPKKSENMNQSPLSAFDTMSNINFEKILNMNDYSVDVQRHIVNVYLALIASLVSCTGGVATGMWLSLGSTIGTLLSFGILLWIQFDSNKDDLVRRLAMLCAFGFFQGISICPLISLAINVSILRK